MDIGLIHRFGKGFEQGARSVNPNIRVLENYVGVTDAAWNNPGRGKELALAQIAKGADVIFTAAGNSGLGAFDAVEEKGRDASGRATHFVIGVDSNQNMVKPGFVLTSMVKRVDNAVYQIVKDVDREAVQAGAARLRPRERRRRLRRRRAQQAAAVCLKPSPPPKRRSARSLRAKSR